MSEGIPKTAKPSEQQLAELKAIQRALTEARENHDFAAAEAIMDNHRDMIEPMEAAGVPDSGEGLAFEEAERLFGKDFFGPKVIEQVFGKKIDTIPNIPFSKMELERAKELGQQLILYTDTFIGLLKGGSPGLKPKGVVPLTLDTLKQNLEKTHDGKPTWYSQDWYKDEEFFKNEKPRTGWRLTSKDLILNSTSKNYLEQTDLLVEYVQTEVFKGAKLPKAYEDAIGEWKRERAKIEPLATSGADAEWKRGSQMLVDLAITRLTRELPVEVMYRFVLNDQIHKDKPLPSTYTWTASRTSDGRLVYVGYFGAKGARVYDDRPDRQRDILGVSFSRS